MEFKAAEAAAAAASTAGAPQISTNPPNSQIHTFVISQIVSAGEDAGALADAQALREEMLTHADERESSLADTKASQRVNVGCPHL